MTDPKIHTKTITNGYKIYYCFYHSVTAFHAFVDDRIPKLNQHNVKAFRGINDWVSGHIRANSKMYGFPIPRDVEELNNHKIFGGMHLLKKIQPKIKSKLHSFLNMGDSQTIAKPKLRFNDKGIGVFSFDMASIGLFRRIPMLGSKKSSLELTVEKLKIALQVGDVGSSAKKVFAHFEQKKGTFPALEVYITAGGNAKIEGDALMYVGVACSELVDYMEARGIPVAVNVVVATSFDSQIIAGIVRVKHFEDRLDKNQLLLLSSDPRYYRYRGFKALVSLGDYFGIDLPVGLGTYFEGMDQRIVDTITDGQGVSFGQSYSIEDAVKEVTSIIATHNANLKEKT
ncbi:hypothetical protein [uncultured Aquimarina sp.]|uniref:hypothetical protein n=1 Tax=uncultured Aquimarina sp. TaxID=575652 RepID=UPI00260B89BC|nr:hypothetical protein [uncultured Aquimarina sp.]